MKDLEEEFIDHGEILNIVTEIKLLIKEYNYKKDSIKVLKKDSSDKIGKLEEASFNYLGENDLKILKTEIPDKWKFMPVIKKIFLYI